MCKLLNHFVELALTAITNHGDAFVPMSINSFLVTVSVRIIFEP